MTITELRLPERARVEAADGTVLSGPLSLVRDGEDLFAVAADGTRHLVMSDCPYDLSAVRVMVRAWDDNPVNAAYGHMTIPFTLN